MKSLTTPKFWQAYADLAPEVKLAARNQYRLLKDHPRHPSLQLKKNRAILVGQDHRRLPLARAAAK